MNNEPLLLPNISSLVNVNSNDYLMFTNSIEKDLFGLSSSKEKEKIDKISGRLLEMLLNKGYAIFSLAFLSLIEHKTCEFNSRMLEIIFIDNSKTVSIITNIIIEVYMRMNDNESFQWPSMNKFINFVFKLPDILSNFFQSSFINYSSYYLTISQSLISNQLITHQLIINKMNQLKCIYFIYEAFKQFPYDEITIAYFLNGISSENCLYYDTFLKELLSCEVNDIAQINNLLPLYKGIVNSSQECKSFEKIEKLIRRNNSLITMILLSSSGYKRLRHKYFESVLILMKDRNRLFIEDVETYDMYMIVYSIYYILEQDKDFDMVNVFDSIMKIILVIMEVGIDNNKKGIAHLLMKYLQKKMTLFINQSNNKPKSEEVDLNTNTIDTGFTTKQLELLDFDSNTKSFQLTHDFYLYANDFKKQFDLIILNKIETEPKALKGINNDNHKDSKGKTKYKSIKYQKKYGVYEKNQVNRPYLEFDKEEEFTELKTEIKLPNTSSKLKINLNLQDNYDDLNKVKAPSYIKDCIIGLSSQYKDRQLLALQHLPGLIDLQPLDLDFALKDLCSALIHINNNCDSESFDELIEESFVKLAKYSPNQVTLTLCEAFFNDNNNCGLKLKFMILNVIDKAVEQISEYTQTYKTAKVNQFHPYFLNVIFPLLNYLKKSKIDSLIVFSNFDHLLAKFIFLISKIIKCSENHPVVYKGLFEAFDLFKAVIKLSSLKTKTHALIEALNAYSGVLISFYNETFILIYPEYLTKVKEVVIFLNGLLEDKALNEDLRFSILRNLNAYVVNIDKFKSNYFGIDVNVKGLSIV